MRMLGKQRMRNAIDLGLLVLLTLVMSEQATGGRFHEWCGILMTVLFVVHQIVNRRWYAGLLRGRYTAYRFLFVAVDFLLLAAFVITALCGMAMSAYAVPFLYGFIRVTTASSMHLSMSHWMFVLAGIHFGIHLRGMRKGTSRVKQNVVLFFWLIAAAYGFIQFLMAGIPAYLFFRTPFAFYREGIPPAAAIFNTLCMLSFWILVGRALANYVLIAGRHDTQNWYS